MAREIKFRGKRIDNGEWVYGNYAFHKFPLSTDVDHMIIVDGLKPYTIDPETLGQYIGIKDAISKEKYEGDIVKITFNTNLSDKPFYIGVIEYRDDQDYPAFDLNPWIDCEMNALSWLKSESDESVTTYEVIGNIHDHPHLLEEANNNAETT